MIKKLIIMVLAAMSLACASLSAQSYQAPEVRISADKVRVNGKSYYAHVVLEKQTLFSIAKAYNVSLQDIYDSNRNLDLESAGLKVGQVIFVPTQPSATFSATSTVPAVPVPSAENSSGTASVFRRCGLGRSGTAGLSA